MMALIARKEIPASLAHESSMVRSAGCQANNAVIATSIFLLAKTIGKVEQKWNKFVFKNNKSNFFILLIDCM